MLRIGLFGSAGSGKDSLFEALQLFCSTLQRVAFGDVVKQCAGPLLALHGVDTANWTREEKDLHRPMLEQIGDLCWDLAGEQWLRDLPTTCVNTRIQRPVEARAWLAAGGVLVEVHRGEPATETEALYIEQMRSLPHRNIYNTAGLWELAIGARTLIAELT